MSARLCFHQLFCRQSLWQQDSYETAITDRTQQRQDSYETAPEDSLYDEDIHDQDEYYDEYEGHWGRRGYPGHVSMHTHTPRRVTCWNRVTVSGAYGKEPLLFIF